MRLRTDDKMYMCGARAQGAWMALKMRPVPRPGSNKTTILDRSLYLVQLSLTWWLLTAARIASLTSSLH